MSKLVKTLVIAERAFIALAALLLAVFAFGYIDRYLSGRVPVLENVHQELSERPPIGSPLGEPDQNEPSRHPTYLAATATQNAHHRHGSRAESLGIVRIPAVGLEVPLLNGIDALTLNRGVGRIPGTSLPGDFGNIGIAGHRDSYFRRLKNVTRGDIVELATLEGSALYRVDQIRITSPEDVSVLRTGSAPSLTLVTCYPFYFVGPAPKRYVVGSALIGKPSSLNNDRDSISTKGGQSNVER